MRAQNISDGDSRQQFVLNMKVVVDISQLVLKFKSRKIQDKTVSKLIFPACVYVSLLTSHSLPSLTTSP